MSSAPHPRKLHRIVLTGFMGSGKSTVGRLLARELGWTFLDLDTEVERLGGRTVPQIFAESGEHVFRRLEAATLRKLTERERVVIALGGGALEAAESQTLLKAHPGTAVVHLSAPFEILMERCRRQARKPGATARPLLADLDTAASRYDARSAAYAQVASHTVETTGQAPHETVSTIAKLVEQS